jgi:hypothetical protein
MKRRSFRFLLSVMACSIAVVAIGNLGIAYYSFAVSKSNDDDSLSSSNSIQSFRRLPPPNVENKTRDNTVTWITDTQRVSASYDPPSHIKTICATWNVDTDEWWVHHYSWKLVRETPIGYCFQQWTGEERLNTLSKLYNNQFMGNCNSTLSKQMWSTGWGADFKNVVDGLRYGIEHNVPMVMKYRRPWHYAKNVEECKNARRSGTLDCYFLPHSTCPPAKNVNRSMLDKSLQFFNDNPLFHRYLWKSNNRFLYEWLTRPQTWLRKHVMDFIQPYLSQLPFRDCTVIHVRRGDVVLHDGQYRRYFPLQDYMQAARHDITKTILLLTDDANAILEAKTLYPNHTWVTMDRKRYQGPQGGWEGHFPSGHPLTETIVLLGTFKLVQQCSVLVHTYSNLAELFWGYMISHHGRPNVTKIQVDFMMEKYDPTYVETVNVSRADWT